MKASRRLELCRTARSRVEYGRRTHVPRRPTSSPPRSAMRAALATFGLALLCGGAGCDGCHRNRPYTPFRLGDGKAQPTSTASATSVGAGAPSGFSSAAPTLATDGRAFALGPSRSVPAPPGRSWSVGLVLDADGDAVPDLLAWAGTPDGERGGLFFTAGADAQAAPVELAPGPAPASAPGCKLVAALTQVGPRSVLVDVARACGPEPGRWLTVVRLADPGAKGALPAVVLDISSGASDAPFGLTVDAADRDGDGRDDVTVTATVGGAPPPFPAAPSASAIVRFLDRPAGLAREPSEPEASMAAFARKLVTDARHKTAAKDVALAAAQLRRLHAALCAEDGDPPVVFSAAGRLACGPARSLEDAAFAEGLAALTLGEPLRAAGALARLETQAGKSSGRRRELDKLVAKAAPAVTASEVFRTTALPDASMSGAPAWIPLAFEPGGDLLVRTAGGVVRVGTRGGFTEEPAPEAPPWPSSLVLPPKAGEPLGKTERPRVAEIAQRCASPWLTALVDGPLGRTELPLPIEIPVAPSGLPSALCASLASVPVVPLDGGSPLRFGLGTEIVELVASERGATASSVALGAASARTVGSARSPDGLVAALPLPNGVLVVHHLGKAKPTAARWTGPDLAKAWSCTPADGARRIACMTTSGAGIYESR